VRVTFDFDSSSTALRLKKIDIESMHADGIVVKFGVVRNDLMVIVDGFSGI